MSVAKGSHCQATIRMIEKSGYCANQSIGCMPKARAISAKTPYPGCMSMFFQTSAATGGITKKGEMTRMRTMPCPHIGWSRRSPSNMPPMTVISSTLPTISSVLMIAARKAGLLKNSR